MNPSQEKRPEETPVYVKPAMETFTTDELNQKLKNVRGISTQTFGQHGNLIP